MKNVNITLDPQKTLGSIRNILGMCNSPRINSVFNMEKEKPLFRKLNPARVRHHDAVSENSGMKLVDVSQVFPLFHADENDPSNYNFAPTDFYFQQVAELGIPIELRFGEQIEHCKERYNVVAPSDPAKWARICVNMLRHYNEGWGNGLHLGITHVSVWEEPDNYISLFEGPFETYLEMYRETALAIRAAFPEVKICGPNAWEGPFRTGKYEQFVKFCAENKLPLDGSEFTAYSRDPGEFAERAVKAKEILKKYGFDKTENYISEWHYWPTDFLQNYTGEMEHAGNAAFSVSALIRMLNCGEVDMAYYYAWGCGRSFSLVPPGFDPLRVYYALCYFTEMTGMQRVAVEANAPEDVDLLASVTEDGNVKLLISCFKAPRLQFGISVPGCTHCRMKRVTDGNTDYEDYADVAVDVEKQSVKLDFDDGGSAVFSLEFSK